jgi:heat shock protein HslJ
MLIAGAAALALAATAASAQPTLNSVEFNGHSFNYDATLGTTLTVQVLAADALSDAYPGGPQPARTQFQIVQSAGDGEAGSADVSGTITFYALADTAGYPIESQVSALSTLLNDRPALVDQESLPVLATLSASQVVFGREEYLETLGFNGIAYITAYAQDVSPLTADRFVYTFTGISLDGQWGVTAEFPVAPADVPTEIAADFDYDAFAADFDEYLADLREYLNGTSDASFSPSLNTVMSTFASLAHYDVGIMAPMGEMPMVPEATPEPTPIVNTDPTLGGLAGTWSLVSFGPADAPVAVAPEAPVTVTFSETGITGRACNSFSGNFSYAGDTIQIGPVAATMMACPEPLSSQETGLFAGLNTAATYSITGDTLTIAYADGVLTFVRAAA